MNSNELNRKLQYKEMQEMLPDYVFGRISAQDKADFESNLPLYPDLNQEIRQVREVFSKVEEMDFNRILETKTRNLSVRVNDRMRKHRKPSTYSWTMKYAVPTMAVVVLIVFTYFNKNETPANRQEDIAIQSNNDAVSVANYLSKADAELIFAEGVNLDDLQSVYSNISMANSYNDIANIAADYPKAIDNIYYEHMAEQLKGIKSSDVNSIYDADEGSMNGIFRELEKLDESEIQSLIEDVKNVRI